MAITSKKINLYQLDQELGGKGLVADFNDENNKIIKSADNSDITESQLEAAIDAHTAKPTEEEIRILNRAEGIAKLKELGFTDEQIVALING
jgi:hypothetical protein